MVAIRRDYESLVSPEELRDRLQYDPETGILVRTKMDGGARNAYRIGKPAGSVSKTKSGRPTVIIHVGGKKFTASRVIWAMVTGSWPPALIDHKNGNQLDNRWENLRPATSYENAWNLVTKKNVRCGFRGVTSDKRGRFLARICVRGRRIFLGVFKTAEEARDTYLAAQEKHHADFSYQHRLTPAGVALFHGEKQSGGKDHG